MEIGLLTPARRWLFLITVLLVVATVALLAAKNTLAEHWAQSSRPEDWLRAARLSRVMPTTGIVWAGIDNWTLNPPTWR